MYLAARPQQRVKIGSRDGGGKSYNLDVIARLKQPSAARAHDAGHKYPLPVGCHARPRPENAIALRIWVLQAEPMNKFEDLVPEERAPRPSRRTIPASMLRDACCGLRARRERPHGRAAEQRDERAALHHSITSSARASTLSGNARPSVLAVLTLIVSSYLIGCCTGNSATFAPLRIRSTYDAARLYESSTSDP